MSSYGVNPWPARVALAALVGLPLALVFVVLLLFGGLLGGSKDSSAAMLVIPSRTPTPTNTPIPSPTPVATPTPAFAVAWSAFRRPAGDNGRGVHWAPFSPQPADQVDRFVREVADLHLHWVLVIVYLPGDGHTLTENDYLLAALRRQRIEPVVRISGAVGAYDGRLTSLVQHLRAQGVLYFQLYNEPNRPDEWAVPGRHDAAQYLDYWLPAAQTVRACGGLPGIGALDPAGPVNDVDFMRAALAGLLARAPAVAGYTWIACHNYTLGEPDDCTGDLDGFARYARYAAVARATLGAELPIICTEGGLYSGDGRWDTDYKRTAELQATWTAAAFRWLARRPGYLLAYCPWLLANREMGGHDERWERGAWFRPDGVQPVVARVRGIQ
ncbi:MAG: hypothetical protein KKA73_10205 [Chloroflexi bacterium]|nr:hypothetical protein [Chloroflexota bacterium]MBU1748049.1 hypothetical protein [Chloroflexota bacterium]